MDQKLPKDIELQIETEKKTILEEKKLEIEQKIKENQAKILQLEENLEQRLKTMRQQLVEDEWSEERITRRLAIERERNSGTINLYKSNIEALKKELEPGKLPKVECYSDNLIIITGASIPLEFVALESQKSVGGDAIKFIASGEDVHFIQFVTHQFPDLANCDNNMGKVVWQNIGSFYTTNTQKPCWRVDGAASSKDFDKKPEPYYDSHGVHEREKGKLVIYDEPGTTMYHQAERIVFTTFLIKKNQPICEVQWSRQYDQNGALFYCVGNIKAVDKLPDWAILVIKEDCFKSNSDLSGEELKYTLVPELDREIQSNVMVTNEFLQELSNSFLPPPANWILVQNFPNAFPEIIKSKVEEKSEILEAKESQADFHSPVFTPVQTQQQTTQPSNLRATPEEREDDEARYKRHGGDYHS